MWPELLYVVAVLFSAYLGWAVILYLMQPRFLYRPVRDVSCAPGELGLDYEDVAFKSEDGVQLNGWWVPAEGSEYTVLFCHGNGGNIMHRLDSIDILNELGLSCFVFDYRGYGRSEGKPNEEGTYLDVRAAYDWLRKHKKVPAHRMLIFGRSLGGSVAAQLAAKVNPGGLVIESGFTSYADMGAKFYPYMPVRWFARFGYKTIDYVKDVTCPILFIHSRNDEIVPFEFGQELYRAASEPKEFVEISGRHNDGFLVSGEVYKEAWKAWLHSVAKHKRRAGQQAS